VRSNVLGIWHGTPRSMMKMQYDPQLSHCMVYAFAVPGYGRLAEFWVLEFLNADGLTSWAPLGLLSA